MNRRWLVLLLFLPALTPAQGYFTMISGNPVSWIGLGMSRDGNSIVYRSTDAGDIVMDSILWNINSGSTPMGAPAGEDHVEAAGISGDGLTTVGNFGFLSAGPAFKWTAASGYEILPGAGTSLRPQQASFDGSTIVGSADGKAVKWTAAGMELLAGSESGSSSASDTSGDGSVIVGSGFDSALSTTTAVYWDGAGRHTLDLGNFGFVKTFATSVSGDGSTIVGAGQALSGQRRPVYWKNGVLHVIDDLPLNSVAAALDVSYDGSVICGQNPGGFDGAFVWGENFGLHHVGPDLVQLGLLGPNSLGIMDVRGVSLDGSVVSITGTGLASGPDGRRAFYARYDLNSVPEPASLLTLGGALCLLRRRASTACRKNS